MTYLNIWEKSSESSKPRIASGATVDIYLSNGKSIRQVVKIGSGYAGTKDTTINLGIPVNETLEKVVVKWKDGTSKEYYDLELNTYHSIESTINYNGLIEESSSTSIISSAGIILGILIIFSISRFLTKRN